MKTTDEKARTIECKTCGAKEGEPCITILIEPRGSVLSYHHIERRLSVLRKEKI